MVTLMVYVTIADINVPGSPFHTYIGPPSAPLFQPPPVQNAPEPPPPAPQPAKASLRPPTLMPRISERSDENETDASNIQVSGRGVQPRGMRVQEVADFKVHMNGAGYGEPEVQVLDASGKPLRHQLKPEMSGDYNCSYKPKAPGMHQINVKYEGKHVSGSPFSVNVNSPGQTAIRAFGPGLYEAVAGQPSVFTISGNSESLTQVNLSIDGPSKVRIFTAQQSDGTVDIGYVPLKPGEYVLHIDEKQDDISGSPFIVQVTPESPSHLELAADDVMASGPGLTLNSVIRRRPAQFVVNATRSRADADPLVTCYDAANGTPIVINTQRTTPRVFDCTYVPQECNAVVVYVKYCGKNVPGSPFHVNVCPSRAHKVTASGPGLSSAKCGEPTWFSLQHDDSITCDEVLVSLVDSDGRDVPFVKEPDQSVHSTSVSYLPPPIEALRASVRIDNTHIRGSPFLIQVLPPDQLVANKIGII